MSDTTVESIEIIADAGESRQTGTGPGANLLKAREAAGLTREDVATSLHLTVRHVANMEEDDYRHTPGLTFERGYLRAYARMLNLDEDATIEQFNQLGLEERPVPTPSSVYSNAPRRRKDRHLRWVSYLIGLTFLILLIIWWQTQSTTVSNKQGPANLSSVASQAGQNLQLVVKQGHIRTEERQHS